MAVSRLFWCLGWPAARRYATQLPGPSRPGQAKVGDPSLLKKCAAEPRQAPPRCGRNMFRTFCT